MDSLISPSSSLYMFLSNNLNFDISLLDLKSLSKLQPSSLEISASFSLPKEINSQSELNAALQSLLSNDPNSKKNDFDQRLSKLHEIEQINKAGLYNVLQQAVKTVAKAHNPDSPKNIFPPSLSSQITPTSAKRRPEEQHDLSPSEVYIRKKIKPVVEIGQPLESKRQATNIVITQPPQDTENSPQQSNLKITGGLFPNKNGASESQKDVPKTVLTFKLDDNSQEFMYLVEWRPRKDGTCLTNSYLSKNEILKIDPSLLVNFYEDQMLKLMNALKQ